MKKKFLLILSVLMIFSAAMLGCRKKEKNTEELISCLKELGNYSCSFDIKVKNDKQEISYSGAQYYNQDYGYRLELGTDRIQIYKDKKIYISDLKNKSKYVAEESFDSVFTLTFVHEYIKLLYSNEEIKSSFKTIGDKKYQLIELVIPGGIRELNKAVLYVDTKTYLPEKLIVYDILEKEKLNVEYKNFVSNAKVGKELFTVK